jgi:hypothetical protein
MKCAKLSGSFDMYRVELSYAELVALQAACAKAGEPVADDMAKAVEWYLENELPGPGESDSPGDAKDKAAGGEEAPPAKTVEPADDNVAADADQILPEPADERPPYEDTPAPLPGETEPELEPAPETEREPEE